MIFRTDRPNFIEHVQGIINRDRFIKAIDQIRKIHLVVSALILVILALGIGYSFENSDIHKLIWENNPFKYVAASSIAVLCLTLIAIDLAVKNQREKEALKIGKSHSPASMDWDQRARDKINNDGSIKAIDRTRKVHLVVSSLILGILALGIAYSFENSDIHKLVWENSSFKYITASSIAVLCLALIAIHLRIKNQREKKVHELYQPLVRDEINVGTLGRIDMDKHTIFHLILSPRKTEIEGLGEPQDPAVAESLRVFNEMTISKDDIDQYFIHNPNVDIHAVNAWGENALEVALYRGNPSPYLLIKLFEKGLRICPQKFKASYLKNVKDKRFYLGDKAELLKIFCFFQPELEGFLDAADKRGLAENREKPLPELFNVLVLSLQEPLATKLTPVLLSPIASYIIPCEPLLANQVDSSLDDHDA